MSIWLDEILGQFKWYQVLKTIVINAIIAVEITSKSGEEKKQLAIKAILRALKEVGISIPVPEPLQVWFISSLIELFIALLNTKFGKGWINKVPEILTR